MSFLYVSEKYEDISNILYMRESLSELFFNREKMKIHADRQRASLILSVDDEFEKVAKEDFIDKISEVISVGYKYKFFSEKIKLDGMKESHKQILLSSIIAADLDDDKHYVKNKLLFIDKTIAIDGLYEFRLKNLEWKWSEIANYIPKYFSDSEMNSFVIYLISEKKGKKIVIEDEKVYDKRHNRLRRVQLLPDGDLKIVKEVLIASAGEIEVRGKLPSEDELYLKEYFGDKICYNPC